MKKLPNNFPLLLVIALLAIVAYVAYRNFRNQATSSSSSSSSTSSSIPEYDPQARIFGGTLPFSGDPSGLILQA